MAANDRTSGLVGNAAIKVPCTAASTAALTLSGEQTIDTVAVVESDRVLVKDQASSIDNGIYLASTGSWTRTADCDGTRDLVKGTQVYINDGTQTGYWRVDTADEVVVGTSSLTWTQTQDRDARVGFGFESRYDIRDYGADTSLADNSTAIQAAIDAAIAAGGGDVFIPLGAWKITTGLVVDDPVTPNTPANVMIQGVGSPEHFFSGSTIDISGLAAHGVGLTIGEVTESRRPSGCGLRNIRIYGADADVCGIKLYSSTFNFWDNVYVRSMTDEGVWMVGEVADSWFNRLDIHSAGDTSGRAALQMDAPAAGKNMNNLWFQSCFIHNFQGHGIDLDAVNFGGGIQACYFDNTKLHYTGEATPPATVGVYVRSVNVLQFTNFWFVGAGHEIVYLDDAATDIMFRNGAMTQANKLAASKYTMNVVSAQDTRIIGVLFDDNAAGDIKVANPSFRTKIDGCTFASQTPIITDTVGSGFACEVTYPAYTDDSDRSLNFLPMRVVVRSTDVSLAATTGTQDLVVNLTNGALKGHELFCVGADVELPGVIMSAQYVGAGNARINLWNPTGSSVELAAVRFTVGCVIPQTTTLTSDSPPP